MEERITPEELEEMAQQVDWDRVFAEATQKAAPEIEALRQARAKSKGPASSVVFY